MQRRGLLIGILVCAGCPDDAVTDEVGTGAETETGDGDGDGDPGDGDRDGDGDGDAVCGDGLVEGDEVCDDGNADNTDVCLHTCKLASCGDGYVGPGEACDDGDLDNQDACLDTCVAASCGDGYAGPGEACDDGNAVQDDACTNACALPSCGDGLVQAGEACDDGNGDDTDACATTCLAASCGDGLVWQGQEPCDDGNAKDTDACTTSCEPAVCGDGFVWIGQEACDDGNDIDNDGCKSDCDFTNPNDAPPQILSFTANASAVDFAVGDVEWILLEADVIDDLGVDRVEFRAGDLLVGVDTVSPYEAEWLVNSVTQSGTPLTATAFDTSGQIDQAGPIVVTNNLLECGTQLWSTPVETLEHVETMAGGNVLVAGTMPIDPPFDEYDICDEHVATYFAGLDGAAGSLNWSDVRLGSCYTEGVGIAGIADGRMYGLQVHHDYVDNPLNAIVRLWAYDANGQATVSKALVADSTEWAHDMTVGANGKMYVGGWYWHQSDPRLARLTEVDPDEVEALWTVIGDWDSGLEGIQALDVFDDGEFVIVGHDGRLARITANEQVVWSLPPGLDVTPTIDVGGPLETIAVHRQVDLVEVREPDGSARWQTPGQVVQVDPNGDVVLMSVDGLAVEKRSGADGSLLCAFPAAGSEIALDEQGFIVVAASNPYTIRKYSP